MTQADYIKLVVYLLPLIGFGLTILSKQSVIAKSAARTHVVQIAQEIVAQIEATIQANPNANLAELLKGGVQELKVVANAEIDHLGFPASAVDAELLLLLQRYGSALPGIAGKLATIIVDDLGATTLSGGGTVAARRAVRLSFARSVGAV